MKKSIFFLIYIPLVFVLVQFSRSNLAQWDMLGHFLASRNFRDTIFPSFVGWNSQHFAGYPQGYLYPSLFHWVVGGLAKVFPLEATFKAVVAISTLFIPVSIFSVFKALYPRDLRKANFATLFVMILYFIPKNAMGGDLFGAFRIGLVNENWGMVFFNFFIASLWRSDSVKVKHINIVARVKCGFILGLTLLSHAIVGLVGLLVLCFDLILCLKEKVPVTAKKTIFAEYAIIAITAFFMGSAWIIPYLMYSNYGSGIGINFFAPSNWIGDVQLCCFALFAMITLSILILISQNRKSFHNRRPFFTAIFLSCFCLIAEVIYRFDLIDLHHLFPLHFYRIQYMILFFFAVSLMDRVGKKLEEISIVFVWVTLAPLCTYECIRSVSTDYNLGFRFPPDARVLVYQGRSTLLAQVAPHQLSDSMQLSGIQTLNGLFAESSLHSRFYMSLENELFLQPMTWGVEPMIYSPRLAIKHLSAFGVGGIVSREPLSDSIKNQISFYGFDENLRIEANYGRNFSRESFSAYSFPSYFAEWIRDPRMISKNWNAEVYDWWMSENPADEVLIDTSLRQSGVEARNANSSPILATSVQNNKFRVDARGSSPGWIWLKESYFPNWHAHDDQGNSIPIFRASPYFMAVFGNGRISFEYTLSWVEKIAEISTFLCMFLFALLFLPRGFSKIFVLITFFYISSAIASDPIEGIRADHLVVGPFHICKILNTQVSCWGVNHFGQLGLQKHYSSMFAQKVRIEDSDFKAILGGSAGQSHTCFYNKVTVWCSGRLGDFSSSRFKVIYRSKCDISSTHSSPLGMCITFENPKEAPVCFGKNEFANLKEFVFPNPMDGLALGAAHVCAKSKGKLWCAGENSRGQLGDGTTRSRIEFAQVSIPTEIESSELIDFSLGSDHTCAIYKAKREGTLYCFGDNKFGQSGDLLSRAFLTNPKRIDLPKPNFPEKVALGDIHTCVGSLNKLFCFGDNSKKQVSPLSDDQNKDSVVLPIEVPSVQGVDEIFARGLGTCIQKNPYYSCWGLLSNGVSF